MTKLLGHIFIWTGILQKCCKRSFFTGNTLILSPLHLGPYPKGERNKQKAKSASELSEAAVANFQMLTANRALRQGKKDAMEGMSSSFVNASF